MAGKESAREEIGCGRDENAQVDVWGNKTDRIKSERIRGTTNVVELSKKAQERRLQWYGHVMRRDETYVGRRVMEMELPGRRARGTPKRRCMDVVREDLRDKQLSEDDVFDRTKWRKAVRNIDPT
ncbi:uncharacterized protein [Macrobrachium rosenbergii]|uniref:uncharacterized protein n=1 Tax=Macrobrachium rosenbergii TaxID=79674 RepID=UPI0034D4DB03